MVCPFVKRAAIAQSVSNASCARFRPARKGWSATRVTIGSVNLSVWVSVFICFSSNQLVFLFPHDEDRARRRSDNPFSCAPNAKVLPTGVAVRSNDDEISVGIFREFDDFVRRDTNPYAEPGLLNPAILR